MKPNLIKFLTAAAAQISFIYIVVFAKGLGISDVNIGIMVALHAAALFFSSYIFGRASDRYGRKVFIISGLFVVTISFILQAFIYDFTSLLIVRVLVGFCIGVYPSALVAYVYEMKKGINKFSSFGSLGWCMGLILAGVVSTYFMIKSVFILSALFSLLAFLLALKLEPVKYKPIKVPFFPLKILKRNKLVYLSVLIRHSGAHIIWTFWPLYLISLGADLFWIAVIESINALTQFTIMFVMTDKFRSTRLLKAGLLLSAITFFTFTLASNFWQILPTQVLLGISWSFMYIGALKYVTDRNVEKATVTGLLESSLSLSSIIGPLLATVLLSFGDYKLAIYVAVAFAISSFIIFKAIRHEK